MTCVSTYGRRGKAGRRDHSPEPPPEANPQPKPHKAENSEEPGGGPLLEGGGREREGEGEGEAGGRGNGPVQASFGPGWEARPNTIP